MRLQYVGNERGDHKNQDAMVRYQKFESKEVYQPNEINNVEP